MAWNKEKTVVVCSFFRLENRYSRLLACLGDEGGCLTLLSKMCSMLWLLSVSTWIEGSYGEAMERKDKRKWTTWDREKTMVVCSILRLESRDQCFNFCTGISRYGRYIPHYHYLCWYQGPLILYCLTIWPFRHVSVSFLYIRQNIDTILKPFLANLNLWWFSICLWWHTASLHLSLSLSKFWQCRIFLFLAPNLSITKESLFL